jgi:hypothetical protein
MVVLLESGTAIHDSSMKVAAMGVLDSDGVKHIGKIAELRQPGSWVQRLVLGDVDRVVIRGRPACSLGHVNYDSCQGAWLWDGEQRVDVYILEV